MDSPRTSEDKDGVSYRDRIGVILETEKEAKSEKEYCPITNFWRRVQLRMDKNLFLSIPKPFLNWVKLFFPISMDWRLSLSEIVIFDT